MADLLLTYPALAIAGIVALGAAAQWLAWRIGLPAILPLLLVGFLVGPLLGWVDPTLIVGETLLFPAISLAVGLILFEGGLTLSLPEVRETRGVVIRLVTVGAVVTWLSGTLAAWWLVDLPLPLAFLFGALIIVTGPTVIGPLLRIVRPSAKVGNVLKWEGILIDAIGAMVAVLVFEFLLIENREQALGSTVLLFLRFILTGGVVGAVAGYLLAWLLRRRLIPDYLINVVALATVFAAFAGASALAPEAGLLATVLMGMVIANRGVPNITDLLSFKEDLTVLSISLLFIVLAANIELASFVAVLNLGSLALLGAVILVIRPAAVFLSTLGSSLDLREKAFLGWIAPRGIVAAAVSSLFASKLVAAGFEGAESLVPLVFLVIASTVLLGSLSAKPVAQALGVAEPDPQGFLILGAHGMARRIAKFLKGEGLPVLLADTNWSNVAAARLEGLPAYYGSVLSDRSDDEVRLSGIGRLLALTSNDEANALAALKYARAFGSQNVFQLAPGRSRPSREGLSIEQRGRLAFGPEVDYARLEELFDRGAVLSRSEIDGRGAATEANERDDANAVPLFLISGGRVRCLARDDGVAGDAAGTLVSLVAPVDEPG
jgi:NhaP-type Na+/H+ or K+/H+ antiporter